MSELELPHTNGCLVCGRSNPHGLHLSLHVNPETGEVSTAFIPRVEDIGFEGSIHGGVLATVLDEAMVWAAIWAVKRMCVAAEMTIRFRHRAHVGQKLLCVTRIQSNRPRLMEASGQIIAHEGTVIAAAKGKYVPAPVIQNRAFIASLLKEPATAAATQHLEHEAGT